MFFEQEYINYHEILKMLNHLEGLSFLRRLQTRKSKPKFFSNYVSFKIEKIIRLPEKERPPPK